MNDTLLSLPEVADDQYRRDRAVWWVVFFLMGSGALLIAAFAGRRLTEPFLGLSLAVLLVMILSWTFRPRATLYVTVFLTVVSDIVTVRWFPFAKNLSSRESISFVSDSLTISPLDISLTVGFVATGASQYARHRRLIRPSPLKRPIIVFTAFVALGFARGILTGGPGDLRVAVLEARPLFYLLLTFAIVVNVCTRPRHLRYTLWWALAGIVTQVLLSINYLNRLDPAERDALESLNEHGSTLGHNLLILTTIGLFTLHVKALMPKLVTVIAVIPTVFVVFVSERRAGIAAMAVAVALLLVVLFWRERTRFWILTPIVVVVALGYLAAFWNSGSALGFPAQAIKSIVAPAAASRADQNSDLYRTIEAFDVNYTIRENPLLGVGFGKPFYRPVPLPDIGIFELNAYIPHHAVLWIWLKLGFFGFVAMFYFFARMIVLGARRVRELPRDVEVVVAVAGLLFAVMFLVFSYVDVSWDARNMVLIGLAAAICAHRVDGGPDDANERAAPPLQDLEARLEARSAAPETTAAIRSA